MPITDEDREFLRLAVQYYIAARSSVAAGLSSVCGNLYHHAIEAFLKARLSRKHSLKELRKQFSHNLPELWKAFKAEFPSAGLAQFDDIIATLEPFERLRYPDEIIKEGAEIIIQWDRGPFPTISETISPPPRYEIFVADIDRLVAKLFAVCSRNPVVFTGGMNAYAKDALTRNNPVGEELVSPKP